MKSNEAADMLEMAFECAKTFANPIMYASIDIRMVPSFLFAAEWHNDHAQATFADVRFLLVDSHSKGSLYSSVQLQLLYTSFFFSSVRLSKREVSYLNYIVTICLKLIIARESTCSSLIHSLCSGDAKHMVLTVSSQTPPPTICSRKGEGVGYRALSRMSCIWLVYIRPFRLLCSHFYLIVNTE